MTKHKKIINSFNPQSGLSGVRYIMEEIYGDYELTNGGIESGLHKQKTHESLCTEVIVAEIGVPKHLAKAAYDVAYYFGHGNGFEAIDENVEVIIHTHRIFKEDKDEAEQRIKRI